MSQEPFRSVSKLASEEAKNVEHNLELLGNTYVLIADLEALFDSLPRLCRFPRDGATNDATYAAALSSLLMLVCRRQLTLGTLTLLRGHSGDSQLHLRKAIEACGYAAKLGSCPHMARVWMEARVDEEAFDRFRNKFKKLWPESDPQLSKLGQGFDRCSKAMHSSIHGVARYLAVNVARGSQAGIGLDIFDINSDKMFIASFFLVTRDYLTMLRVFGRLLEPYATGGIIPWKENLTRVEKAFRSERDQRWHAIEQCDATEDAMS
jgi:hypothetical protein